MTESFEQKIEREVKDGTVPGVVLIAGDKEGTWSFRFISLEELDGALIFRAQTL